MSKYNLTKLLSEMQGGRIGTLNTSAMSLEMAMEKLEGEGIKINRLYDSPDGKTYIEYHVHPEGKYDPDESFSVYDFKFGEDPTSIDNEDKEYPFSIGGRGSALSSAKALLGSDLDEGMGYEEYEDAKEEERLDKHPDKEMIKKIKDMINKEKPVKEGEAVDLAIEASQEKAGIEVDESFDSLAKKLDKQKGITKKEAGKIAGKIANIKRKGGGKGPTAKQKKRMDEGVIKSIMQVLKDDAKATNDEIKQYLSSLMRSGDSFDDLDDYVEDFKEYVADKSLQEHFKRFM